MRYHIDTIPVWDAVKAGGECPLCAIQQDKEAALTDSVLGGAVMEPDRRVETNREGFCARHHAMLYEKQNRLGHALMTHTHLLDVMNTVEAASQALLRGVAEERGKPGVKRTVNAVAKRGDAAEAAKTTAAALRAREASCHMCARMTATMERYAASYVILWEKEKEFREAVLISKGLCLPHCADVLDVAASVIGGEALLALLEGLAAVQKRKIDRIESELRFYTQKFDYRNQDMPWGESRDAPERAMGLLRGPNTPQGGK